MKERPILFSAPMVRAILDGSKTQTRRAFSAQIVKLMEAAASLGEVSWFMQEGVLAENDLEYILQFCPYGQPGDRLWVREGWTTHECFDAIPPRDLTTRSIHYVADGGCKTGKYRQAFHMPRWASRINREITGGRVERLQDISEEDAKAEGTWGPDDSIVGKVAKYFGRDPLTVHPSLAYQMLWELINGAGSWAENPWVWVIEIKEQIA